MDLSGVLDWLETAPVDDVDRVVRIGARVARDRRNHLAGAVRRVETRRPVGRPKGGESIEVRAREILKAFARPVKLQDVVGAYAREFKEYNPESIRTTLSRKAKAGEIFTKSDDGLYGLLEWKGGAEPALDQSADSAPELGTRDPDG